LKLILVFGKLVGPGGRFSNGSVVPDPTGTHRDVMIVSAIVIFQQ